MITLLASIAGFVSSIVPECIKIFKDKYDKKHELDIMDKQIELSKLRITNDLKEIEIYRDIAEHSTLYNTFKTGVSWVDALNGTVRPAMAYSFFALYCFIKYIQYDYINHVSQFGIYNIEIIWNEEDQAIFAGIISFYFGQRTFSKLWKNK